LLCLPESRFPCLYRQVGALAAIFHLREILLDFVVAFTHLPLAKFVTVLFLLEDKEQIFLPIAFPDGPQSPLRGLYAVVSIGCQLPRVTFTCEDGFDDGLSSATDFVAHRFCARADFLCRVH
jgi:hypothetical protein